MRPSLGMENSIALGPWLRGILNSSNRADIA